MVLADFSLRRSLGDDARHGTGGRDDAYTRLPSCQQCYSKTNEGCIPVLEPKSLRRTGMFFQTYFPELSVRWGCVTVPRDAPSRHTNSGLSRQRVNTRRH